MVDRIKKGFEKTLSKFWPKLDLRVSAKSGKVNSEKFDYNRSRSEIFKIVSNNVKLLHPYELADFIFK